MSRFSVGVVGRGQNVHASCFEDVAVALAWALRENGHEVVDFVNPGRIIALGANNVVDVEGKMPKDVIVFNSEQLTAVHEASTFMSNFATYRSHCVWDYSQANIKRLQGLGIERAVHCPIGFTPTMVKDFPKVDEDIDVLFYGAVNDRRREILDALDASGLKVAKLFGVYGAERDAVIARAKVVLNLHFYDKAVFEIFRVSHLLANHKCVVSENGGVDEGLEDFARRATIYTSRDQIVEACQEAVSDVGFRKMSAERGHTEFKKTNFAENVKLALEQSV